MDIWLGLDNGHSDDGVFWLGLDNGHSTVMMVMFLAWIMDTAHLMIVFSG